MLPKISEIKWDDLDSYELSKSQSLEIRNYLLNLDPPAAWIKKHFQGFHYLPIDKVEYLMTKFFKHWYVEIMEVNQMANAAYCRLRLFYLDPDTDSYLHQDGVGAASFQVDKGSKPADMSAIKQAAVEMAVPKAEVAAFKDAADKIGRIFGRDIGRKNTMPYEIDTEKFKNLMK